MSRYRPRRENHRKQPEWMRNVKVGDVLRSGRGTFRVVRSVAFFDDGQLRSVQFVIRHCSWTGRCLTSMNYTDMVGNGYEPTRIKWKMNGPLDPIINAHAENHRLQQMHCCDVIGIA